MVNLSPDTPQILQRLRLENIQNLYHFTNIANLSKISEYDGLCSKHFLESRSDWPCPSPGGNTLSHNLDRINDNWDKIGLNFTPHTPMVYNKKREGHICFFLISPEVATWEGIVFTDTNATKQNHRRDEGLAGLSLINFNMIKSGITPSNPDWKKLVQAEVLVPTKIPLEFVSKIVFVSEASMNEGEKIWGDGPHPHFEIDHTCFQDFPDPANSSTGFSYVSKAILTDSHVDRKNVDYIKLHKTVFKKQPKGIITAVINLEALAGTKGKLMWNINNNEDETEFERSDKWNWWPSISIEDIPVGHYCLEIQLNDVKWSTLEFEVVS